MIRNILVILCLFVNNYAIANIIDIDYIRTNYSKSVDDKIICNKLIKMLERNIDDFPIYRGYYGGLLAIKANHVKTPWSKYQTFLLGKTQIEKSIVEDNNNIELRYIRLSIQYYIPSLLGYKQHINSDIRFIKDNINKEESILVMNNIINLLKQIKK